MKCVLAAVLGVFVLPGCASHPSSGRVEERLAIPANAMMTTAGARITALDGSWTLAADSPFTPPSVSPQCFDVPSLQSPAGRDAYRMVSLTQADIMRQMEAIHGGDLSDEQRRAIQQQIVALGGFTPGCFKVRVHTPNRTEALYGVMLFSAVPTSAEALAQRVWRVAVPEEYVAAAHGGLVSLVYQPFHYRSPDGTKAEAASWVLWMSDVPLWQ